MALRCLQILRQVLFLAYFSSEESQAFARSTLACMLERWPLPCGHCISNGLLSFQHHLQRTRHLRLPHVQHPGGLQRAVRTQGGARVPLVSLRRKSPLSQAWFCKFTLLTWYSPGKSPMVIFSSLFHVV